MSVSVLDLSGIENVHPSVATVADSLADVLLRPSAPRSMDSLRRAIAVHVGLSETCVVIADSEDAIVAKLIRLFLNRGDAIAVPEPTYGIFRYAAQSAGIEVLDTGSDENFEIYQESLAEIVTAAEQVRLVFLASPNNPTGKPIRRETIIRILETGTLTAVDESHIEFGGRSCADLIEEYPNLVVMRGFKWASLDGLNVAYALAAPPIAARLAAVLPIEPLSGMALSAAESAIRHAPLLRDNLERIARERDRMTTALDALPGVIVHQSGANFVFCQFPDRKGRDIANRLFENGVKVRHYPAKEYRDGIRIRVGHPADTDRLLDALKKSLA